MATARCGGKGTIDGGTFEKQELLLVVRFGGVGRLCTILLDGGAVAEYWFGSFLEGGVRYF